MKSPFSNPKEIQKEQKNLSEREKDVVTAISVTIFSQLFGDKRGVEKELHKIMTGVLTAYIMGKLEERKKI